MVNNLLLQVREGMAVYDLHGKVIGHVEFVQFGDENPAQPGPETLTARQPGEFNTLADTIAEVFNPETLPETLRDRLIRYGYVRVDVGLLGADRFVLPDQIASVDDDVVHLRVEDDQLVKR